MTAASPLGIMTYYRDSLVALGVLRNVGAAGHQPPAALGRFVFMTPGELEQALMDIRTELELEVGLALCASYEALLRGDYLLRAERKLKDPASRKLRTLHKEYQERLSLDTLLDAWKRLGANASAIGEFKQMWKVRDWLAHGRYWSQKSGIIEPTPEDLFERGEALTKELAPHAFPIS